MPVNWQALPIINSADASFVVTEGKIDVSPYQNNKSMTAKT